MAASGVVTFTKPEPRQASIRPAQLEILLTTTGDFQAELMVVELPGLWVQRGQRMLTRTWLRRADLTAAKSAQH